MKRPRKILIFGNIGSGKTSLARSLSEAIGIPCGSIDACRISYSDGSPSGEASAWSHFLEKVESSESLILECVGGGPFFELLKMALDKSGAELTVLFVHTPAEECLKRVKIRGFHAPYPHFSQSIDEVIHSLSLSLRDGLSRLPNVVNILDGEKSVEDLVEEASALIGKKTHPASDSESASKGSSPLSWKHSKVSACGTHHVNEGKALYGRKFDHVLPFHTPGLAPVDDYSGAYHIYPDGSSAYSVRFKRTVGFYQGFAAVEDRDGKWFHILPDGEALYTHLYAWSGNYQNGYATVRDLDGFYFHVDRNGERLYRERWSYAGDYREGSAVIQCSEGRHTHIDCTGTLLHGVWWQDLDVYHKGYARAQDESGWTHIQYQGEPVYERRFAQIEPFYNGQARVLNFDGSLEIIDESGDTVHTLRSPSRSVFAELSGDMVGFWKTETIASAVELGIPDALPASIESLSHDLNLNLARLSRFLIALGELDLVIKQNGKWSLTAKGAFLRSDHPTTLADAALEYGNDLQASWKSLPEALRQDSSWEPPTVFENVASDQERLLKHHRMLRSYARHDYEALAGKLEIPNEAVVVDAGGGLGTLAEFLSWHNPDAHFKVLDLPQVVKQACELAEKESRLDYVEGDLFKSWPIQADVILLARVLHDWADEDAEQILLRARKALKPGGRIYVIEMAREGWNFRGGLCDLHLLACTGGQERGINEFGKLLHKVGLRITVTSKASQLTTVLTAVPEEKYDWVVPDSTKFGIEEIPQDRPVAMLLRHSVRPFLPPDSSGDEVPLTEIGVLLSKELGGLLGPRLASVSASPLARTMQTGKALVEGANVSITVNEDKCLGDPGVYSYGAASGKVWARRGHEEVMKHLVSERSALAGLANPHPAARFLVHHMLTGAAAQSGVHAYVTHDSLITATVGQLAGIPLTQSDWPLYLEAAFFWRDEQGVHVRYREINHIFEAGPLCPLTEENILEMGRRELALTIGLDCKARFYLAGGVFKSLLTGRAPKDLDIWAASEADRQMLIEHLVGKGALREPNKPYTDEFYLNDRAIEIKKHVKEEHLSFDGVVGGFDLVLSAIAVEHLGRDRWRTYLHPRAWHSYEDGEVALLENLRNWKHSLATLVRMQKYADELGLNFPDTERDRIWSIFKNCDRETRMGMLERFRSSAHFCQKIEQEALRLI